MSDTNVRPIRPGVDIAAPAPVIIKMFRCVVTVYRGDPDDDDTPSESVSIDLVDRWQGNTAEACSWVHDAVAPLWPGACVRVDGGYLYDEVQ